MANGGDRLAVLEQQVEALVQQSRPHYFKDKIAPPLLVAGVVAISTVWGTHILHGARLDALEQRATRVENQMSNLEHVVNGVAVDTAFIRGKIENRIP